MPSDEVMSRQEALLEAFVEAKGDIEAAQAATKTPRHTFFMWLRDDDLFRQRFDEYRVLLAVDVENEAVKRVLNPQGLKGSDALATTLLKGLKPARYREEQKGAGIQQVIYVSGLRETPRLGAVDGTAGVRTEHPEAEVGVSEPVVDRVQPGLPAGDGTPSAPAAESC